MGVVIQIMKSIVVRFVTLDTFFGVLIQATVALGLGLIVYGAIAIIFKSPEASAFIEGMRLRFLRKAKPIEAVDEAR